jgi:hypothetical protein
MCCTRFSTGSASASNLRAQLEPVIAEDAELAENTHWLCVLRELCGEAL